MGICYSINESEKTIVNKAKNKRSMKKKNSIISYDNPDYILSKKYSIRRNIAEDYKLDRLNSLGSGNFGTIYLATDSNNISYAVKQINKSSIKNKEFIINEVKINSIVNHENIVKCLHVYEDLKTISFILELVEGGDLFNFIKNFPGGHLNKEIALDFIIQILETIDYLHNKMNICHRDIKPENFLVCFEHNSIIPKIKIIDFGLSCFIPEDNFMTEMVGSPLYQAPEMLETGRYSKMADLWSVGIILYNMLTGCDPFSGNSDQEINEHVLFDEIDFSCIENVKMKEFCEGLLDKNPEFRLSAKKALKIAYEIYDSFINDVEMEENKNNFNNLDNKNLGYLTMDQIKMKYKINTENMFCQNCLNFDDFSYMIKNKLIIAI